MQNFNNMKSYLKCISQKLADMDAPLTNLLQSLC